ncbi:hypothetical protein G6F46_014889 [Rhizopus delemar]|nr:hypothetical protein G6F46_014889 [Rhizopus delemar]
MHVHAQLVLQAGAEVLAVAAQALKHHRPHRVQVDLVGLPPAACRTRAGPAAPTPLRAARRSPTAAACPAPAPRARSSCLPWPTRSPAAGRAAGAPRHRCRPPPWPARG